MSKQNYEDLLHNQTRNNILNIIHYLRYSESYNHLVHFIAKLGFIKDRLLPHREQDARGQTIFALKVAMAYTNDLMSADMRPYTQLDKVKLINDCISSLSLHICRLPSDILGNIASQYAVQTDRKNLFIASKKLYHVVWSTQQLLSAIFIKCAVKPRRLGRGYKAQSFKAGFVAAEYTV